ncbi:hypothetical protein NB706_002056 [Xanthomonas sacchari]|nr:hypothetical protein [Xanthomonas sacchari]
MKAYTVVGPTNFQPRAFSAFDNATDSGEVARVCAVSAAGAS